MQTPTEVLDPAAANGSSAPQAIPHATENGLNGDGLTELLHALQAMRVGDRSVRMNKEHGVAETAALADHPVEPALLPVPHVVAEEGVTVVAVVLRKATICGSLFAAPPYPWRFIVDVPRAATPMPAVPALPTAFTLLNRWAHILSALPLPPFWRLMPRPLLTLAVSTIRSFWVIVRFMVSVDPLARAPKASPWAIWRTVLPEIVAVKVPAPPDCKPLRACERIERILFQRT